MKRFLPLKPRLRVTPPARHRWEPARHARIEEVWKEFTPDNFGGKEPYLLQHWLDWVSDSFQRAGADRVEVTQPTHEPFKFLFAVHMPANPARKIPTRLSSKLTQQTR